MLTRNILIVDDNELQLRLLERLLQKDDVHVLTATSGPEALTILKCVPVSVIISDYQMPEMSGVEFLNLAKEKAPHAVRIMLTGRTDAKGAIDAINRGEVYRYLTKPWDNDALKAIIEQALIRSEILQQTSASQPNEESRATADELGNLLRETQLQAVMALSQMTELVGANYQAHAMRVGRLAQEIGRKLHLGEPVLTDLFYSSLLHDLWKIGLRTNRDQQAQLRFSLRILETIDFLRPAAQIVRYHRENYDGSGWPERLRGEEIPLGARIVAAAEAYDNLRYNHSNRPQFTERRTYELIRKSAGRELDPGAVHALGEVVEESQSANATPSKQSC